MSKLFGILAIIGIIGSLCLSQLLISGALFMISMISLIGWMGSSEQFRE